jgi:hypothetical protein
LGPLTEVDDRGYTYTYTVDRGNTGYKYWSLRGDSKKIIEGKKTRRQDINCRTI